jgi:hypothetical protein
MLLNNSRNIAIEHEVDDLPLWGDWDAHSVLMNALSHYGVPEEQFARLIAAYRDHAHKQRTRGLTEDIDDILMTEAE